MAKNGKKSKLALVLIALMAMMHSRVLLAEAESPEAKENSLPASQGQAAMVWSLMPGESVSRLARLFYPKNKNMQQLFIAETLHLSRKIQPNLTASSSSNQITSIVIPDIKRLAEQGSRLKLVQIKTNSDKQTLRTNNSFTEVVTSEISPTMPLVYDELIKKNEFLKLELEKLNVKLTYLQQVLDTLKVEVAGLFTNNFASSDTKQKSEPLQEQQPSSLTDLVKQDLANPANSTLIQNSQANPSPVTVAQKITSHIQNQAVVSPILVSAKEPISFKSQYLWMSILPLVLVISFFIGFIFHSRRNAKDLYLAATGKFNSLGKKAFIKQDKLQAVTAPIALKSKLPIVQNEFTHSMPGADLSAKPKPERAVDIQFDKNEAELILEQAKIFVQIDRPAYAIKLLKTQINAAPKAALHHWLYLLDIYRNTNQEEEFLKYAEQLHQNFNVVMPLWDNTPSKMMIASSIEEFTHISNKVTKLWADCEKEAKKIAQTKVYLDELLTDNRDSERAGFSMEVFQEIILLRDLLDVRDKLVQVD